MSEPKLAGAIDEVVGRYPREQSSLIPILQDVQGALGYLSEQSIGLIARAISVSENEVYGVATFYAQFRFRPPAQHSICACLGTACYVRGGRQVLHELEERLHVRAGETTPDGKIDLERVACVGCCALAPVVVVDGKVHAGMSANRVQPVLSTLERQDCSA